jgi:hypothetical protein
MTEQARVASTEPFARIFRHWIGERPYVCLGANCPLCDVGDAPEAAVLFSNTISGPEDGRAQEVAEIESRELETAP